MVDSKFLMQIQQKNISNVMCMIKYQLKKKTKTKTKFFNRVTSSLHNYLKSLLKRKGEEIISGKVISL